LRDPTVEAAVLETARGGILREGLGFDECDVGAVLNIAADHLGSKSINTLEDLAAVKSVVVESVRSGGCSVLNTDDPLTLDMRRHAGGRLALFTLNGSSAMSEVVRRHIERDGLAVVREPSRQGGSTIGGDVIVYNDGERHRLMAAAEIGATLSGIAEFNLQNAMAAAAMAVAHGIEYDTIRAALSSFASSFEQNPGRLNVHDGHGFRVVLDYAHNPAGLRALTRVTDQMRPHHRRVIGMVSIPGDRRDCDIREMGEISAASFDRIVFRERPDGRGRSSGEIIALLVEGAIAAGFDRRAIDRILDEDEAVAHCLRIARRGDLIVLTPTDYERAWAQVQEFVPDERQISGWMVERMPQSFEPEPAGATRREPLRNGPMCWRAGMSDRRWAIILHGGAKEIAPEEQEAHRAGCRAALLAGIAVLQRGGTAVEAVEATIRVLEDDPTFNAGRGSAPNAEGRIEMDAGLMEGVGLRVGAVAALRGVRHPISVARRLLPEDPVLLVGAHARDFAAANGAELCDEAELRPDRPSRRVAAARDTVGCVALDRDGHIAAGTSTGGLDSQAPGRVGDSPLPGCGLYADDSVGGVSLSGDGEEIIRVVAASRIVQHMSADDPQRAVEAGIAALRRVEGEAGAIAIDRQGRFGWAHNTPHFAVGSAAHDGPVRVWLARSENAPKSENAND
jgi:isoaspartyl peptidase/L-asparaginase-like protein (Ntn-hydrolase superfamily)/UDP-N-acetylmuramyl tripeptide synthase